MIQRPKNSSLNLHGRVIMILILVAIITASIMMFYVVTVVDRYERTMLATLVGHEISEIVTSLGDDPNTPMPRTSTVNVYLQSRSDEDPIPHYLLNLSPDVHKDLNVGDQTFHVAVVELNQDRLYFEFKVTDIIHIRYHLIALLIGGGMLVILVLIITGMWLSRKFLKPMDELAIELTGINPDDRNVRLADKYRGYEVSRIAESFDDYMSRMDEFVIREQSFAAAVSHELRTPVAVIGTSVDLLELKGIAETQKDVVGRIKRAAEYMGKIIESLLLSIRNSRYDLDDTLPEIKLNSIFESVVKNNEDQARLHNVDLKLEIKSTQKVRISENHVEIVLANLVRNAINNTEEGKVMIQLTDSGFSVVDNGRGIEPDEIEKIVQLSYHNPDTGGYGVGLYLVKNICKYYGFEFTIESKAGEGSRFAVSYPSGFLRPMPALDSNSGIH